MSAQPEPKTHRMSAQPEPKTHRMSALPLDILVVCARVTSTPTLIFALRRICKSWRDAVDSIDERSIVWQELLVAFGVAGQLPHAANKKAAFVLLLCEPCALIQRCAEHANTLEHLKSMDSRARRDSINSSWHKDDLLLLKWVLRVGEEAATRWLLPINDVLMRKPMFDNALGMFGMCPCAGHVFQARLYQEWQNGAPELAARIANHMKDASQEDKRLALDSFESLTRKVGVRLLHPAVRWYVYWKSVPTTQLIGQEACNLLRERLFNN